MEFDIPGMTCGHCTSAVTQTLQQLDPGARISIDLPAHKVTVETTQARQAVADALTEAGFPTH